MTQPGTNTGTLQSLTELAESNPENAAREREEARRPVWDVSEDGVVADRLRDEAGRGKLAGLFLRDDRVVHVPRAGDSGYEPLGESEGDDDGPAQVRQLRHHALAAHLDASFTVQKVNRRGEVIRSLFPLDVVTRALAAPELLPHVRRLRAVTHTPLLRPDGSVLDRPGYDEATRTLYLPERGVDTGPVAQGDTLTPAKVQAARKFVEKWIGHFEFVTKHDRAAYIGAALTPLLKLCAPPPWKLTLLDAPTKGSGKTYLAKGLMTIHGGVMRVEMPDNDELRKQITSILMTTTAPVVVFDNVEGVLRSSIISGLLTLRTHTDRPLGTSGTARLNNDRLWVVTGNNLTVGGDMGRRKLRARVDPGVPNPHLRDSANFGDIGDFTVWTRRNRGPLVRALLTLATAGLSEEFKVGAGDVVVGDDTYERWRGVVGGIIDAVGFEGVFDTVETDEHVSLGEDEQEWLRFLEEIHAIKGDQGWSVDELVEMIEATSHDLLGAGSGGDPGLKIPLSVVPGPLAAKMQLGHAGAIRSLRWWLKRWADKYVGNLRIVRAGERGNGGLSRATQLWQVEKYTAKSG